MFHNSLAVQVKTSLSSDIETKPGPAQENQNKSFSICHWNLNSTTAHCYGKVSLLKAYITVHKMISFVYRKPILTLPYNRIMKI